MSKNKQVRISDDAHQLLKIKSAELGLSMMEHLNKLVKERYAIN